MVRNVTAPENQSAPARTETSMSDDTTPEAHLADAAPEGVGELPGTSRSRGLIYGLVGAGGVIVTLGVIMAILLFSGAASPHPPAAMPPVAPSQSVPDPTPSASPSADAGAAPQEPARAEPDPANPAPAKPAPVKPAPVKPAPVKPAPVLPAPPAPVIPPLSIDSMSAIVSGGCTGSSTIVLTWHTTGADTKSTNINVRSGGGTPIFDQNWSSLANIETQTFYNIDCTRPVWFFTLTVTNSIEKKKALLTFAHGKTAGWSWGAP